MLYPIKFISLGPGDPELITLKALKSLQSADIVLYPTTKSRTGAESSRAYAVLTSLDIPPNQMQPFSIPMNKDRLLALAAYYQVALLAKEKCTEGKKVVIVAEGDTSFYSSVHYINDYLKELDVLTEFVAGVPAFIACGALAKIPVVKQEEELNVIPGVISYEELSDKIQNRKVVVVMKVSQCEQVIKQCVKNMPNVSYHYFENVGVTNKEYYTQSTEDILSLLFPYFSLMIIHRK